VLRGTGKEVGNATLPSVEGPSKNTPDPSPQKPLLSESLLISAPLIIPVIFEAKRLVNNLREVLDRLIRRLGKLITGCSLESESMSRMKSDCEVREKLR
jgi:hypothetical protein